MPWKKAICRPRAPALGRAEMCARVVVLLEPDVGLGHEEVDVGGGNRRAGMGERLLEALERLDVVPPGDLDPAAVEGDQAVIIGALVGTQQGLVGLAKAAALEQAETAVDEGGGALCAGLAQLGGHPGELGREGRLPAVCERDREPDGELATLSGPAAGDEIRVRSEHRARDAAVADRSPGLWRPGVGRAVDRSLPPRLEAGEDLIPNLVEHQVARTGREQIAVSVGDACQGAVDDMVDAEPVHETVGSGAHVEAHQHPEVSVSAGNVWRPGGVPHREQRRRRALLEVAQRAGKVDRVGTVHLRHDRCDEQAGLALLAVGLELERLRRREHPGPRHGVRRTRGGDRDLRVEDDGGERMSVEVGRSDPGDRLELVPLRRACEPRDRHVGSPAAILEHVGKPGETTAAPLLTGAWVEPEEEGGRGLRSVEETRLAHETTRLPPSEDAACHAALTARIARRSIHSVSNSGPTERCGGNSRSGRTPCSRGRRVISEPK